MEEAAKAKANKDEAKAACDEVARLLADAQDCLSGAEDDLERTKIARDLAKRLAVIAEEMKGIEGEIPPIRFLRLRDALQALFVKGSKAHEWYVMVVCALSNKAAFLAVCSAVAEGVKQKFAVNNEQYWLRRIINAKLETDESPAELAQRISAYNTNGEGKADEGLMLTVFVETVTNGGNALVASAMIGKTTLKEAAAAAQEKWEVVRKASGADASGKKVKVAAVGGAGAGEGEGESGAVMEEGGCWLCGKKTEPKHGFRSCPKMPCTGCGRKGHMLSDCPNKSTSSTLMSR